MSYLYFCLFSCVKNETSQTGGILKNWVRSFIKIYRIKSLSNHSQMFFKIGVIKIFCKIHRKTPVLESLFDKVAGLKACSFILRTPFYRTLLVTAYDSRITLCFLGGAPTSMCHFRPSVRPSVAHHISGTVYL